MPTLMEKLIKDLGMSQIACAYGMTETSPVSLSTSVEDSIEDRCGTVGRLMPHLEMKVSKFRGAGFVVLPLVKIVNADEKSHDPLEIGQVGEILVKGYSVMLGYYKVSVNPAQERSVFVHLLAERAENKRIYSARIHENGRFGEDGRPRICESCRKKQRHDHPR